MSDLIDEIEKSLTDEERQDITPLQIESVDPLEIKRKKIHTPTDKTRSLVEAMALAGAQLELIADVLKIAPKTLTKHYDRELYFAAAKADTRVVQKLYKKCMNGDTTALIFWCKTRLGWKEGDRTNEVGSMIPTININVISSEPAKITVDEK